MNINKFSDVYKRFEKYISPIGLIYGFVFTSLTLTRVDMFLENFWIVMHLFIASFGILALAYFENQIEQKKRPEEDRVKFHFYLTLIIQFAFGGLFSTFFVFYMRSSSLATSWLFLLILVILLIGNELWKKHYTRLVFQISVLYLSLYLFLVFLLPVLFHRLGSDLFIASGVISLLAVISFGLILKKFTNEKFRSKHNTLRISAAAIFIVMNILYFTNIIPPIPLSLKDVGVYHSIIKTNDGNYKAQGELTIWSDRLINNYPVFHLLAGETIYVFSAIFSPVEFDAKIVHLWQYYNEAEKTWIDSSRVVLSISGGREEGFRTYSMKQFITPGLWRVKVITIHGQELGRINFRVEEATSTPELITKTL